MQSWKLRARGYWQGLTVREQRLLVLMGGVVGLALGYLALWQPAQTYVERNRSRVLQLQAELVLDRKLAAEASTLQRAPRIDALDAAELKLLVERSLQDAALPGQWQLASEGEQGVRLSGEVPFDAWMQAVGELSLSQLRVVRMKAAATGTPGMVKLEAVLVHGGGQA